MKKDLKAMTKEEVLAHKREIKRRSRQRQREREKLEPGPYAPGASYTEQRRAIRARALAMVKDGVERQIIAETCGVTKHTLSSWIAHETKISRQRITHSHE